MNAKSLCLGALCLGDGSGYDIKKLFEDVFSHFYNASFGSIYPALEQLSKDGLVTFQNQSQDGKPDRKVYSLTAQGRSQFIETLSQTAPEEKVRSSFLVLMFFAHLLSNTRLKEVLESHRHAMHAELDYLLSIEKRECQNCPPGMSFGVEYGIATTRAAIKCLEQKQLQLIQDHKEFRNEV